MTAMATTERLDRYRLHEHDWESFEALREWFEWEVPDRFNMAAYVCDRWAEETPEATALFVEDHTTAGDARGDGSGATGSYTFAEFEAEASRLANHLAASGDATACVVDESNADALRRARDEYNIGLGTVLVVDGAPQDDERAYADAVAEQDADREAVETDAEDDALLIYTSGTTGDPKGVRHVHRMLLGHLPGVQTNANFGFGEGSRFWTPAEWAWIASLFDLVFPALYYGRPVLAYHGGEFDPEAAFDLLDRYDITMAFIPPTALRFMMQVDSAGYDVDTVEAIGSGGESLGESVSEWAEATFGGALVHEGYGQTEANVTVVENGELAEKRGTSRRRPTPNCGTAGCSPRTSRGWTRTATSTSSPARTTSSSPRGTGSGRRRSRNPSPATRPWRTLPSSASRTTSGARFRRRSCGWRTGAPPARGYARR